MINFGLTKVHWLPDGVHPVIVGEVDRVKRKSAVVLSSFKFGICNLTVFIESVRNLELIVWVVGVKDVRMLSVHSWVVSMLRVVLIHFVKIKL